ncbi:MAG: ABC transporter substrate-binding protein, partial [Firmicutes bacterium]|nr:ABC transporter substrate-binding protein [Bacillota bacterium]
MVRRAVLLWLAVVAFAAGSGAAPAGVVRLGAVIPLTGRFASGGAQVRTGYEMAVEDLNARGGVRVGGQQLRLELVVVDDESDPTKTVSRMEALAQQDIAVYLGGFGSDLHAAAAAVAEKN